jgi:putative hemolysin
MGISAAAATGAVVDWLAARGASDIQVSNPTESAVCARAVLPGVGRVAVLRPRAADKREYSKVLAQVYCAQRGHDAVYVTTTRGALQNVRMSISLCGAGILRVSDAHTVTIELEPRVA